MLSEARSCGWYLCLRSCLLSANLLMVTDRCLPSSSWLSRNCDGTRLGLRDGRSPTRPRPMTNFCTSSRARYARRTRPSAGVRSAAREAAFVKRGAVPARHGAAVNPAYFMHWAPRAALRPFGPRRRRRAPVPPHRPRSWGVATSQRNHAPRTRSPSSRRLSIEPRKITIKSELRASHTMAQAPLLTLIFHGSFGTYRRMATLGCWPPPSLANHLQALVRGIYFYPAWHRPQRMQL